MSKSGRILVVDDNLGIRRTMEILLPMYFAEVKTLSSPSMLVSALREVQPHVVLLDMNFTDALNTGNEGLFWAAEVRRFSPMTEVVLFTAYADIQLAVEGMKRGAFDFIVKPWDNAHMREVLTAARDKSMKQCVGSVPNGVPFGKTSVSTTGMLWGNSPQMQRIRETVEKIAATDVSVLITGENGTGKDLLAREIHRLSLRRNSEMVAVDAGAIPESLFESEMFGHTKGAFTDAKHDRIGKFEQANQSTLFLDEIGNIPLHLQPKLLRALQNRTITRVGDTKSRPVDIRLISATNANIEQLVQSGEFREDLYYRINTIRLDLPPLRERQEDIVPLAEMFIRKFAEKYHRRAQGLTSMAGAVLRHNPWHGNIRELENCIEKAVIMSDGDMLTERDLTTSTPMSQPSLRDHREQDEERLIRQAMQQYNGNISAIAKALGISRPTLYAKLKKYGL